MKRLVNERNALIAVLVVILLWFFLVGCAGDTIISMNQEQDLRLGDLPCCPEESQQGNAPLSVVCAPIEPNRSSFRLIWTGGNEPWRVITTHEETGAIEQHFDASTGMIINPIAGAGVFTVNVNGQTCTVTLDQ